MKKCLQGRILPSQYLWKILSLHIQEQVAMSHTGSRKKTWMILLVICICQNSTQSSWLKQWNQVQEDVRNTSFRNRNKDLTSFFNMENKLCYCTNIPGLQGYGVPNVTQDSFSPFLPQLLPAKPWSCEWWAWRKIPPRHYEDGEQLSRQMEPRHDGRLLLDALAWHPRGKIHQIF